MSKEAYDSLMAALERDYDELHKVKARIVVRSAHAVAYLTRATFPDARYIVVEETDQDLSGSLVADDLLNGAMEMVGAVGLHDPYAGYTYDRWRDEVWAPLSNMQDDVKGTYELWRGPDYGSRMTLDLEKLERAEL